MATESGRAVIGEDLIVYGEVRNGSEVEVRGSVQGTVTAARVVIQPGGSVVGVLDADSADVLGLLDGRVRVRNLINIGNGGVVHGDVRYGQLSLAPGGDLAADVRNVPPELGGDFEMVVKRGRSVRVTSEDLAATDREDGADLLTYRISNPVYGHLALDPALPVAVDSFRQRDIASGIVHFVHDGSGEATAGFDVVVEDSQGATSGVPRHVSITVIESW